MWHEIQFRSEFERVIQKKVAFDYCRLPFLRAGNQSPFSGSPCLQTTAVQTVLEATILRGLPSKPTKRELPVAKRALNVTQKKHNPRILPKLHGVLARAPQEALPWTEALATFLFNKSWNLTKGSADQGSGKPAARILQTWGEGN